MLKTILNFISPTSSGQSLAIGLAIFLFGFVGGIQAHSTYIDYKRGQEVAKAKIGAEQTQKKQHKKEKKVRKKYAEVEEYINEYKENSVVVGCPDNGVLFGTVTQLRLHEGTIKN